jgi:hypothetical protein
MPPGNSSVKRPHGFSGVLYIIGRNGAVHKTTNAVWSAAALRLPAKMSTLPSLADAAAAAAVSGDYVPYSCSPHSVLSSPDQRPARECSPGATGRVQGQQPMEV